MNTNLKIHCLKDLNEISNYAFEIFSDVHHTSNDRFYIIPGGVTPKLFLNLLSNKIKDWRNTHFILSDERLIDDINISNQSMVNKEFLSRIDRNEKPILLEYNQHDNQSYINNILESKSSNLTILGLGSDCHTASLFPGNSEIIDENNNICLNINNTWENYKRVSLSFAYLMKSDKIIFMASGEEKADALKKCLVGEYDPIQFPAQYIINNYNNDIHILCDQSAGKYII